eukprot:Filipodium_phascolosomae@DN2490_c0_g1_i3.p1
MNQSASLLTFSLTLFPPNPMKTLAGGLAWPVGGQKVDSYHLLKMMFVNKCLDGQCFSIALSHQIERIIVRKHSIRVKNQLICHYIVIWDVKLFPHILND